MGATRTIFFGHSAALAASPQLHARMKAMEATTSENAFVHNQWTLVCRLFMPAALPTTSALRLDELEGLDEPTADAKPPQMLLLSTGLASYSLAVSTPPPSSTSQKKSLVFIAAEGELESIVGKLKTAWSQRQTIKIDGVRYYPANTVISISIGSLTVGTLTKGVVIEISHTDLTIKESIAVKQMRLFLKRLFMHIPSFRDVNVDDVLADLIDYDDAAHKPINQWSHALVIEDRAELEDNLRRACSYEEWKTAAAALDRIKETEKNWSDDDESTIYDFRLIRHRRESLQKALAVKDISELIYLMRSGLLRNLGGLNEIQLYSHLYLKTKRLIEDYHNEVVLSLQEILNCPPSQQRENFISDTRQSFGSTALVLRGGATFSLTHLGVAKALFEQSLLPRIITGSSISALVAALICIRTDDELPAVLDGSGINLSVFEKKRNGAYQRKVFRWLETGFILDPDVFTKFVQVNIGDMTFEEAFQKTRRILNITVNSRRFTIMPN
ncbi:hypothetical protein HDU82_000772 [Entophlyctis luteolus]|nr:hypothetical protein HDU82_000772 [Entophlyctis luteolus]